MHGCKQSIYVKRIFTFLETFGNEKINTSKINRNVSTISENLVTKKSFPLSLSPWKVDSTNLDVWIKFQINKKIIKSKAIYKKMTPKTDAPNLTLRTDSPSPAISLFGVEHKKLVTFLHSLVPRRVELGPG